MKKVQAFDLTILAMFLAIIIVMTAIPFLGYIPLGAIRATLLHIPVIIASIVLGAKYGAILGFVFGLTSLITNTTAPTATSFVFTPFVTLEGLGAARWLSLVICFVPRILVGVVPHYVYKGLSRLLRNKKGGVELVPLTVAGIAGSLTNTVLVMGGIYLFFGNVYAQAKNMDFGDLFMYIINSVILVNGVAEAIVAAILTTAIAKALLVYKRKKVLN